MEPVFGVLPPVFYSWYQLNYVRLSATVDGGVVVGYELFEKEAPEDETWFQRLVTPAPRRESTIPPRTIVRPTSEPNADVGTDSGTRTE